MARQVSEFVVVPPEHKIASTLNSSVRFKAYLAEAFPGYTFTLQPIAAFEEDEFQVIPVMGKIGDQGGYMCEYPDPHLIRAIREACDAFDPAASRWLAA
ncbi:hypothetical protein [Sinorhizobium sp. GL28]|uniref:hypothetical protein n=1 Tax=Sinorhizobium sp. GL28 TaxID=1358418 RepID=UPI00071D6587|nr:hypothetical protein [Sinorhizobium sp. GL28]KSV95409.1 hypothetical protein N184_00255 [Sinorhizobium sp. GL28]